MYLDYALLLMRVVVGLVIAGHGAQKLFGWFGGNGIKGTAKNLESLNIHPGTTWGYVNGIAEFGGGLLTALGLLSPLGPVMIVGDLITAIAKVHWAKGFWNSKGGYEYPLTLIVIALAVGMIGAGAYSADAYIGFALPEPQALVYGLAVALIGFALVMYPVKGFRTATRRHRA